MSELAKAIFDWLNQSEDAPYTWDADEDSLIIGVDGRLDCEILAEALASRSSPDWQPIETAPKDGSWVLVAAGTAIHETRWWKGFEMWLGPGRSQFDRAPTHWRPLPAPPATPEQNARTSND